MEEPGLKSSVSDYETQTFSSTYAFIIKKLKTVLRAKAVIKFSQSQLSYKSNIWHKSIDKQ